MTPSINCFVEGNEAIKKPSPLLYTLKGREYRDDILLLSNPWCHPNCPFTTTARKDRFFVVILRRGNHPPALLADYTIYCPRSNMYRRLSSVSRSRMRSERASPFRTSTLLRIAVGCCSHTNFAQCGSELTRFIVIRIPAKWPKVKSLRKVGSFEDRQRKPESSSLAGLAFNADVTIVPLDQSLAEIEP